MFRYIQAMSYDRHKIEEDLRSAAKPITYHLTKLYLFPNSQYEDHWRKEIWNFLNTVPKMKSNNKYPNYKLILDSISGYADVCDNIIYVLLEEYSSLNPMRVDADELEVILNSYFEWLATELSTKGAVRPSDVYNELDKLDL